MLKIKAHDINIPHRLSLKNFEAEFAINQMTAIIGLNGAGKSTLIDYIVSSLQKKSPFFILNSALNLECNDGAFVFSKSIEIAYAPQTPTFHPHLFWPDVFKFLPTFANSSSQANQTLNQALDLYLPFFNIKKAPIYQLSKGNIQLVNLLITFVQRAQLLIFDEPNNHLDWLHQKALIQALKLRKQSACILVITHDLHLISKENGFDQVLYLDPNAPNGFYCWDVETYQAEMEERGVWD